jgi:hypothetical protein
MHDARPPAGPPFASRHHVAVALTAPTRPVNLAPVRVEHAHGDGVRVADLSPPRLRRRHERRNNVGNNREEPS